MPDNDATIGITLGTAQATTSGTFKDFTIPSGAKRITVMLDGVSTNGTSDLLIQIGDSEGIENTGYVSATGYFGSSAGSAAATSTAGYIIALALAANIVSGNILLTKQNESLNTWTEFGSVGGTTTNCTLTSGGKSLSLELDRIRITTVNGTDAFDAGSINVSWEF
jgi:hypothetical protein